MSANIKQLMLWHLLLTAAGLAVFFPGIGTPYYGDDFSYLFDTSARHELYKYFYRNLDGINLYRPLQASFLWIVQHDFGLNSAPIQIVQIYIHVLLSTLVFETARKLGLGTPAAMAGSLLMLAAQAGTMAVISPDTFSQVTSTLFGSLGIRLYAGVWNRPRPRAPVRTRLRVKFDFILSLVCLGLACLSKENGLSFLAMAMAMNLAARRLGPGRKLRRSLCFIVLGIIYLYVRSRVIDLPISYGPHRYELSIGLNNLINIGLMFFAAGLPASTVDLFVLLESGRYADAAGIGSTAVIVGVMTAVGLYNLKEHRGHLLWCGLFGVIACYPMALMGKVSELYVYNLLPFASLLAGAALVRFFKLGWRRRTFRFAAIAVMAAVLGGHASAAHKKAGQMKAAGDGAHRLIRQMEPYLAGLPAGGTLLLVNPPEDMVDYSVFLYRGFNALTFGLDWIRRTYEREDATIRVIERVELDDNLIDQAGVVRALGLTPDSQVRLMTVAASDVP